jgi:hypothetical protein
MSSRRPELRDGTKMAVEGKARERDDDAYFMDQRVSPELQNAKKHRDVVLFLPLTQPAEHTDGPAWADELRAEIFVH